MDRDIPGIVDPRPLPVPDYAATDATADLLFAPLGPADDRPTRAQLEARIAQLESAAQERDRCYLIALQRLRDARLDLAGLTLRLEARDTIIDELEVALGLRQGELPEMGRA